MTSKVEIANMALANIEAEALVESLDSPYESEEARYCDMYFEQTRKYLMRQHNWNFAITHQALASIGTAPAPWSYQYQFPTDCMKAIEIAKTVSTDAAKPFAVGWDGASGKYIWTDEQDATLKFVKDVTDPTVFDVMFVEALAWGLAFRISGPITGSQEKKQTALTVFRNLITEAQSEDAEEGEEDNVAAASWIEARL